NGNLMAAKILDFGLSSVTRVSDSRGTPLYMSPEQASGDVVTEAADVFAMGIVAYELLTGRHPFADTAECIDRKALARNIATVVPVAIKELNPHVADTVALVIHKALAKDPKDRPSSGEVFRLLRLSSVYGKERHSISGQLAEGRKQYEDGDLDKASESLS